jgi:branched-chain amino acid transport system ATP-binding protein
LLTVKDIATYYGSVYALKGVSLTAQPKSIVVVLGANGAGKSTLLRTISGLISASRGQIEFEGKRIERMSPHRIVRLGISQVPEGRELFRELSVLENLMMGAYIRQETRGVAKDLDNMFTYFPILKDRKTQIASTLSGGEQQMLAIARALMSTPRLLLLDEPSLGLAPLIVEEIYHIIRRINLEGTSILLGEQNANLGLSVASRGYVLETGRVTLQGRSDELAQNDNVRKAYLGK